MKQKQCRSLHTTRLPFKFIFFVFFLDQNPATAEKVRLLKETNKRVDLNKFLQHLMSSPVLSENPVENRLSLKMTMEHHHGRNTGRFYKKNNLILNSWPSKKTRCIKYSTVMLRSKCFNS